MYEITMCTCILGAYEHMHSSSLRTCAPRRADTWSRCMTARKVWAGQVQNMFESSVHTCLKLQFVTYSFCAYACMCSTKNVNVHSNIQARVHSPAGEFPGARNFLLFLGMIPSGNRGSNLGRMSLCLFARVKRKIFSRMFVVLVPRHGICLIQPFVGAWKKMGGISAFSYGTVLCMFYIDAYNHEREEMFQTHMSSALSSNDVYNNSGQGKVQLFHRWNRALIITTALICSGSMKVLCS